MTKFQASPVFAHSKQVKPLQTGTRAERTAVVVPCYNEEKRLNVQAFVDYLETTNHVDFVFVNDGSQDDTELCLKQLQSFFPNRITVLSLNRNSGKAEAVRQGLMYAAKIDFELLGYWDADLATPLSAIDDFILLAARLRVSVIFGSRRQLVGHRIKRTFKRRVVSKICAALARVAIQLPVGDTQCGAKLFRNTSEFRASIKKPFTAGWLFDVELFSRLSHMMNNRHRQFYEHPLCEWSEIEGSNVTPTAILKSGFRMLQIIGAARFGFSNLNTKAAAIPEVLVNEGSHSLNSLAA